jgi:outer membrane protein assembly factor BamB
MSNVESKPAGGSTESDCRTFFKRIAVVGPLGRVGEPTWLDARSSTTTIQTAADEWPMYGRDPTHTGFNPGATGPEPPVEVKWRVSGLPSTVWPPVVVGDAVYVGTGIFDRVADGDLRAFSTDRGTRRWTFVPSESGVGVPAVVDGTIYVGGNDGNLNAIDVDTKELHWTFDTPGNSMFPKVADGTVYATEFGWAYTVYAIDAKSGEEQWRFDALTGPAITVTVSDGTVYVGPVAGDSTVYAVDATSGEERWRFEEATEPTGSPIVVGERLYVGTLEGSLYALT